MEIATGIPVASIGPSVASVYGAELKLNGGLHFTVSQSGASPDIIAVQEAAKRGGATTVAVVNVTDSPLAKSADIVLALHAGEEKALRQPSLSSRRWPLCPGLLLRPARTKAYRPDWAACQKLSLRQSPKVVR